MTEIGLSTYFLFDMLYLLLQVFGYTAGMLVCFIAGYYFGSVARKYVNK
jgi:hypothetical protein